MPEVFDFRETTLLTKEQLESELNILKISWGSEFDNLTNFPEEEIKQWLVSFINDNEDHMTSIQESCSECKTIEDELFSLRVKQNITISPLKDYIENWIKDVLNAITPP
jgi:hypothetical protein